MKKLAGNIMQTCKQREYKKRFNNVLTHMHRFLDTPLTLDDLACVAHFSKYHFQRQFSSVMGMSPSQYLQQLRLERSAFELAFRTKPICDIAFASQFQSQEAYSRSFKKYLGKSPLNFRKMTPWEDWHSHSLSLANQHLRMFKMDEQFNVQHVEIIDFNTTNIARLTHVGQPALVMKTVSRFIEWRRMQGNLSPKHSDTFNVLYNDPNSVAPSDYRFDVACGVNAPIADNDVGVENAVIEAGKCARLTCIGSNETMAQAIHFLYEQWLLSNDAECDDRPLFVKRVTMHPEVPMTQQEFEIYLPIK